MSLRRVKLGDLGTWGSGGTPLASKHEYYGGDIPWLIIEDLNDGIVSRSARRITLAGLESSSAKIVPPGTLLIAMYGSIGKLGITEISCATNQAIAYCKCDPSRVDTKFLFFLLLQERARFLRAGRGGTQQNISQEFLKEYEIHLPALSEQKRIAVLLERADRLRRTRRCALELSDTFLPAAFLELFGEPALNPKGWCSGYLGDVLLSAQDGPHVSPDYCELGVPFLSTRNVRPGEILWDDLKYISRRDAEEQWRKVKPEKGDILYTKGGTTGLAKAVDFDREVAVWVHIAVLKLRREVVVPVWLENMLNSAFCYRQSQELTFGIVNRDLGLKRMPRIRIYIPPLPLQQEFAGVVQRFERLRAGYREALRQAEHLFQSLLHRAFAFEISDTAVVTSIS